MPKSIKRSPAIFAFWSMSWQRSDGKSLPTWTQNSEGPQHIFQRLLAAHWFFIDAQRPCNPIMRPRRALSGEVITWLNNVTGRGAPRRITHQTPPPLIQFAARLVGVLSPEFTSIWALKFACFWLCGPAKWRLQRSGASGERCGTRRLHIKNGPHNRYREKITHRLEQLEGWGKCDAEVAVAVEGHVAQRVFICLHVFFCCLKKHAKTNLN